MKLINKLFKYIISFSIIIASILIIIDICCFDKDFYYKQYKLNNTMQLIRTDNENLVKITNNLLDYLKDKNDDINITYIKNGVETNVYQDIELIHMSDVKDLYKSISIIKIITVIISIVGIVYLIKNKQKILIELRNSIILILFLLLLIGISCIVDFNSFWISFHKIFFTKNDYWLLDPRKCILVNLFTSNFFFNLCTKICMISIIVISVIYIIIYYYEKKTIN